MKEEPLKKALASFLDKYKLADPMARYDVVASWEAIMGRTIAKHTLKVYIRDKKLFVHVDSSVLRNELDLARSKILKLVNEHAGRVVAEEVVLL